MKSKCESILLSKFCIISLVKCFFLPILFSLIKLEIFKQFKSNFSWTILTFHRLKYILGIYYFNVMESFSFLF